MICPIFTTDEDSVKIGGTFHTKILSASGIIVTFFITLVTSVFPQSDS